MHILGITLFFTITIAAIVTGSDFGVFINVPSFLICLGCGGGLMLIKFGKNVFSLNLGSEFRKRWLQSLGWSAIHAGWVGALIGALQIANGMKDISALQPALVITFLPVFYGYCTYLVCKMLADRETERIIVDNNNLSNKIAEAA